MASRRKKGNTENLSNKSQDTTFEMMEEHEQRPVTDAILESYGQVGSHGDRDEAEQAPFI